MDVNEVKAYKRQYVYQGNLKTTPSNQGGTIKKYESDYS